MALSVTFFSFFATVTNSQELPECIPSIQDIPARLEAIQKILELYESDISVPVVGVIMNHTDGNRYTLYQNMDEVVIVLKSKISDPAACEDILDHYKGEVPNMSKYMDEEA
jgi:hypothetical protein